MTTHPLVADLVRRDHIYISRQLEAAIRRKTATAEDQQDRENHIGRREREIAAHERLAQRMGVSP